MSCSLHCCSFLRLRVTTASCGAAFVLGEFRTDRNTKVHIYVLNLCSLFIDVHHIIVVLKISVRTCRSRVQRRLYGAVCGILAGNLMSEINVKVRWRAQTLYDTKVIIEFEETVRVLKKKICEKDSSLQENLVEIIYCGCVMEDCNAIYMYDIFDGATVHVFKRDKCEKQTPNKPLTDGDLVKLGVAFRSLTHNSSYRSALMKLSKPEVITNIIISTPGLNEDPVALTLLQHSELLVKLSDFDVLKRISESHPALAAAALQISAAVHEEVLQVILLYAINVHCTVY